ncbi:BQ2448_3302 [Microbotryum intermedium]|uniref:Autophagy protein 5 n=1 Tax=Microbotryum intermedium TaxID=269621 RepID=A0A238FIL5_9BASI|nr:BQ2448_3302 [Microbotryum intermedium]
MRIVDVGVAGVRHPRRASSTRTDFWLGCDGLPSATSHQITTHYLDVSASLSTSRYLPTKSRASSSASTSTSTPSPSCTPAVTARELRSLVYHGSIPLQIHVAPNELPPKGGVDPALIEAYYIQASRISYLPLLLSDLKEHYLDLALDPPTAASISFDDLWFECERVPLKWQVGVHWPIGLLYDYHSASSSASSPSASSPSSSTPLSTRPSPRSSPTRELLSVPHLSSSYTSSLPSSAPTVKPFKPLDLPWKITLHLKDPPKDALLLSNAVEACRTCFMNMVKEADHVRWGSVKRVTNLRKELQDGLWEGVVSNDFDKFWTIASRLVPPPPPPHMTTSLSSIPSTSSAASSENYNSAKSVPLRLYLPEGGPVLQDQCPPLQENGTPAILVSPSELSFEAPKTPLAQIIVQGVVVPLDTEVGWLGACLAGADGWVGAVVSLL